MPAIAADIKHRPVPTKRDWPVEQSGLYGLTYPCIKERADIHIHNISYIYIYMSYIYVHVSPVEYLV